MRDEFEERNPPEDDLFPPDGRVVSGAEYITGVGQELRRIHPRYACEGEFCVIHNPSDHCMRTFPTQWRGDRGIMERICPHGIGHPDPDDQAFITRMRGPGHMEGVHGCDGCCQSRSSERGPVICAA